MLTLSGTDTDLFGGALAELIGRIQQGHFYFTLAVEKRFLSSKKIKANFISKTENCVPAFHKMDKNRISPRIPLVPINMHCHIKPRFFSVTDSFVRMFSRVHYTAHF